jgi:hypothetical protein
LQTREGGDAENKSQNISRTTMGGVFSSNHTTPGMSFAAALRGRTEEQQQSQTHQVAVAGPATMEPRVPVALPQHEQQITGQLVRAPHVNSLYLEKMLKAVVAIVEQIMKGFNGAVLEEASCYVLQYVRVI